MLLPGEARGTQQCWAQGYCVLPRDSYLPPPRSSLLAGHPDQQEKVMNSCCLNCLNVAQRRLSSEWKAATWVTSCSNFRRHQVPSWSGAVWDLCNHTQRSRCRESGGLGSVLS